jgi:hypothetical protein
MKRVVRFLGGIVVVLGAGICLAMECSPMADCEVEGFDDDAGVFEEHEYCWTLSVANPPELHFAVPVHSVGVFKAENDVLLMEMECRDDVDCVQYASFRVVDGERDCCYSVEDDEEPECGPDNNNLVCTVTSQGAEIEIWDGLYYTVATTLAGVEARMDYRITYQDNSGLGCD